MTYAISLVFASYFGILTLHLTNIGAIKMRRFALLMFIILLPSVAVIAQDCSPEFKRMLQGDDAIDKADALENMLRSNIPQAVPIIESQLLHENRGMGAFMLFLVAKYKSPNFIKLAHQYLNVVDTMRRGETLFVKDDLLRIKYDITRRLFNRNDFSTFQCVFDLIKREKPNAIPGVSAILETIIKNLPEQEDSCKSELVRIAKETDSGERVNAFATLCRLYGKEFIRLAKDTLTKTPKGFFASEIIDLLLNYKDDELRDLLYTRLISELPCYENYAELILKITPEPYVYQWLLTSPQIPASQSENIDRGLDYFEPPYNDSISILQSMKNLYRLVDTSLCYKWIGNAAFANELKERLDTSISKLNRGDSLGCREDMQKFSSILNEKHDKTNIDSNAFVHAGGWKFLSTNAEYILEKLPPYVSDSSNEIACFPKRVPVGFGSFTLQIVGKHFTPNSKVLVNDSTYKTLFMSDSLLTITIPAEMMKAARPYGIRVDYMTPPLPSSKETLLIVGNPKPYGVFVCGHGEMPRNWFDE